MEPGCGYRDTGARLSGSCLFNIREAIRRWGKPVECVDGFTNFSFCASHGHPGDQHALVVRKRGGRQNRDSWRVEAGRRRCHGHLCELCHRAIHATVLLKNESKAA
jgi:hypothetical protein